MQLVYDRIIGKMTFPELGVKYGVRKWTAWEIFQREIKRDDLPEEYRELLRREKEQVVHS